MMYKRLLGIGFFIWLGLVAFPQNDIWRIEPPHWWAGMQHTELQIMIYGERVADAAPSVTYPGVSIGRVERTSNPNYLFLYLRLTPDVSPGTLLLNLDEKTVPYVLKEREAGSAERQGFGPEDVIYLITPDRFANGDESNDEVSGMQEKLNRKDHFGRHGGDLQGILNHLDYIADMGFTAIWLNPVVENNMPRQSYHGYAATDFYRIDPRYGTLDDYKKLSQECRKRGVRLIMDQIMNHCGSGHWWMKDLPDPDWFHHGTNFQPTSHMRVVLHDPYVAASDIERFTNGWFVADMPDMNQDHPLLADYLIQNSIWWVEEAGLQGIRHDTHPYAGKEFMQTYSCRIMQEYPRFNIVGEEWSINPLVIAKWQRGKENPDDYTSCTPSMFDFPLQVALTDALRERESWNTGWIKVYEMLSNDLVYADPSQLVTFPDNHDMDRFYTQIGEDFDRFKMGMAYYVCMRGIPQFYYGTELLMTNSSPGNHGEIRSDFPGGWPGDEKNAFTGQALTPQEAEAQRYVQTLLRWRRDNPVLHRGQLMHYAPDKGVYVFFRYTDDRAVMVAFNKNDQPVSLTASRYPEMLRSDQTGTELFSAETIHFSRFKLSPQSVSIIEYNR